MTIKEAIEILKNMKSYYNDRKHEIYEGFELDDNEAIDKAIKLLEQEEKGYIHQQIERNIQYKILEDSKKAQLSISVQNFINTMGGIDIQVGIQTTKEGD